MKTEYVIRNKTTQQVLFYGNNIEECQKVKQDAFFDHIDASRGIEDFPLEAVTIHTLEESEMDTEEDNSFKCPGCGEWRESSFIECPGCDH